MYRFWILKFVEGKPLNELDEIVGQEVGCIELDELDCSGVEMQSVVIVAAWDA